MRASPRKRSKKLEVVDNIRWNPLEGHCDEVVPFKWDASHVGVRLADAFETLAAMPGNRGPRAFGSGWPAYAHEFEDLVARAALEQKSKQFTRRRVSLLEATRMERALCWPAHYIRLEMYCEAVNRVSMAHAFGRDCRDVAAKHGLEATTWLRRFEQGCEWIANGLNKDRVTVF